MMPFSVLRIWSLGLLSWAILGTGLYLLWEYADRRSSRQAAPEHVRSEPDTAAAKAMPLESDSGIARDEVAPRRASRLPMEHRDWPYLAGGVTLVLLSFGGVLPVLPFLGKAKLDEPLVLRDGEVHTVSRPDGTQLRVEVYGQKHSPTLVFTHGWSLDSTAWSYAKRELAEHFRIVTWDLPGLGLSRGPDSGDYSLEKMARDLEAVLAVVAREGTVFLVGHSIGGMISQTFCRLFPEQLGQRVHGLVLLHTTYTNPLKTALGAGLWRRIQTPILVPLNHLTIWLAPLAWLSNWQSYFNGTLHIFTRIASFAGQQTWGQVNYGARLAATAWPAVVARGNLAMLNFDEQATLENIGIPVLVIAANHDRMTKRSASEHIEDALPQGLLASLSPAGHLGFWEQHERFAELVTEFVNKFTPKAPPKTVTKGIQI